MVEVGCCLREGIVFLCLWGRFWCGFVFFLLWFLCVFCEGGGM